MKKIIVIFCLLGAVASGLQAQYGTLSLPIPIQMPSLLMKNYENSEDLGYPVENYKEEITPQSRPERATPVNFRFTPNATQRNKNMKNFIAEVAKVSPEYAPQLAAELGNGTAFQEYNQALVAVGLNSNNIADNMAVWWLHAWEASAGRPITVPDSAFGVVKAQVERMLNNPEIAALSNADKQKMSDDMIVRTLIMANQIEQAKSNPDFARQLAAGTKESTKKSGMDLDKMTLTDEGFRPVKGKKRSDASDAGGDMPGTQPSPELANAATPAPGGNGWSAGAVALMTPNIFAIR